MLKLPRVNYQLYDFRSLQVNARLAFYRNVLQSVLVSSAVTGVLPLKGDDGEFIACLVLYISLK